MPWIGSPDRSLDDHRHDKAYAVGFLVFFIPLLAVFAWLVAAPLKGQREGALAGFALMAAWLVVVKLAPRSKTTPRTVGDVRDNAASSPVVQAAFPVLLGSVFVVTRYTGQAFWSPLVGMFAGLGLIFVWLGVRFFTTKRPG